ncbi:hypothetical protein CTEN210_04960 [Chaetoceros tenuissimus]|uniref:Uncharacterized protein n=1 Tax=Chaetoceros tenuissimus TaxID=426638 RepID=A0AAD3H3E8_9STRA|nr:hypothetical protein CTEN210_04960 [Chaetoceros tenuissimus]
MDSTLEGFFSQEFSTNLDDELSINLDSDLDSLENFKCDLMSSEQSETKNMEKTQATENDVSCSTLDALLATADGAFSEHHKTQQIEPRNCFQTTEEKQEAFFKNYEDALIEPIDILGTNYDVEESYEKGPTHSGSNSFQGSGVEDSNSSSIHSSVLNSRRSSLSFNNDSEDLVSNLPGSKYMGHTVSYGEQIGNPPLSTNPTFEGIHDFPSIAKPEACAYSHDFSGFTEQTGSEIGSDAFATEEHHNYLQKVHNLDNDHFKFTHSQTSEDNHSVRSATFSTKSLPVGPLSTRGRNAMYRKNGSRKPKKKTVKAAASESDVVSTRASHRFYNIPEDNDDGEFHIPNGYDEASEFNNLDTNPHRDFDTFSERMTKSDFNYGSNFNSYETRSLGRSHLSNSHVGAKPHFFASNYQSRTRTFGEMSQGSVSEHNQHVSTSLHNFYSFPVDKETESYNYTFDDNFSRPVMPDHPYANDGFDQSQYPDEASSFHSKKIRTFNSEDDGIGLESEEKKYEEDSVELDDLASIDGFKYEEGVTNDSWSKTAESIMPENFNNALGTKFSRAVCRQFMKVDFKEKDRQGKRKDLTIGFPGFACYYCNGSNKNGGRFFPSTLKTMSDSKKTLLSLYNHILKCRKCPEKLKKSLKDLRPSHDEERKLQNYGSQKTFFSLIWANLHNIEDE